MNKTVSYDIRVKKASGELQEFSDKKLSRSLENSGADPLLADEIVEHIRSQLYDGISTFVIYKRAFAMLKSRRKSFAARYNLKQALFDLGPTGFPFERFIARIFDNMGYETEVGVMVSGKCVTHEVDIVLDKGQLHGFAECKFHNKPGTKCNIKTPLYVLSRFEDICKHNGKSFKANKVHEGWLVTNTRFTNDALAYGSCVGLKLLGWNTGPLGESLERLIDTQGLHPITCLTSLKKNEKRKLLDNNIVLCQDLFDRKIDIQSLLFEKTIEKATAESKELCTHSTLHNSHD